MNLTKTCTKCGITKPLNEFYNHKASKDGKYPQCKKCKRDINNKYHQKHKEEIAIYHKKYNQEHIDEIRKQQCHISMYENKSCASYLGIVIAERLCRHLFKDVQVMPNNNMGFDIICNKGKKIDVKSASVTFKHGNPKWTFRIDYNTTADYFVLIAFDNRTDLNPLYLWMIPGKEINENSSKSIRPSTVHKWDKWKRDIKDAQLCCNEIKAEQGGK